MVYCLLFCLLFYIAWTLALFAWRLDLEDPGSREVLNLPRNWTSQESRRSDILTAAKVFSPTALVARKVALQLKNCFI